MYGVRQAMGDILLALGGTAMLFSVVFFLFILLGAIPTRSSYLGLVTVIVLPLVFILGGVTLVAGIIVNRRFRPL